MSSNSIGKYDSHTLFGIRMFSKISIDVLFNPRSAKRSGSRLLGFPKLFWDPAWYFQALLDACRGSFRNILTYVVHFFLWGLIISYDHFTQGTQGWNPSPELFPYCMLSELRSITLNSINPNSWIERRSFKRNKFGPQRHKPTLNLELQFWGVISECKV